MAITLLELSRLFQSTLPHGSDALFYFLGIITRISIHAPSRERPMNSNYICYKFLFQSTLPHGSDCIFVSNNYTTLISIHAPSRERHFLTIFLLVLLQISIHAPSRERPIGDEALAELGVISIHAPSRERHLLLAAPVPHELQFQSTLPHGSDLVSLRMCSN